MSTTDKPTFASLGRVEAIRQLFEGSGYTPFEEPLWYKDEDGASYVNASRIMLEGTDFNLEYFPLKHLGYKSVLAVTGELYSVLAHPKALSITLGVSAKLDFEQIRELWSGVLVAAKEHGYAKISLDLVPSRNGLAVSVNAFGCRLSETEIKPSEAKSKDLICVSGRLGAAYLGQQVLERKPSELEKYKMMLGAYLKPEIDPATVSDVERSGIVPSYGYFVSRGLADAVLRLHRDSGMGVKLYADRIPFEGNSFSLGKELDIDPLSAAMNGGDDFCLMYVISLSKYEEFKKNFNTFEVVGHLALPEVGAVLVTPDGLEHQVSAQGWM